MSINCRLAKMNVDGGEISCEPYFTSIRSMVLLRKEWKKILNDLDNYLKNGSGWTLEKVLKVYINVAKKPTTAPKCKCIRTNLSCPQIGPSDSFRPGVEPTCMNITAKSFS